jgi:hypothetical protein
VFSPINIQPWQSSKLKRTFFGIAMVMLVIAALLVYLTSITIALPALLVVGALASRHFLRLRKINRIEVTAKACRIYLRTGESRDCFFDQATQLYPQFIDLKLVSVHGRQPWWCPIFEDAITSGQFSDLILHLQNKQK